MATEFNTAAERWAPASENDEDPRFTVGWTSAAIAIHSILQIPTPMFLRLGIDGQRPILIDFQHHAFDWDTSLALLPSLPSNVSIETEPAWSFGPSLFPLPGRSLDQLLWTVGLHSFRDQPASWLNDTDRYRLCRWPNFPELEFTVEQMKLTAILANLSLTPSELAATAHTSLGDAQRVINALSLMGILVETPVSQMPALPQFTRREPAPAGLFARLRERLGF